MGLRCQIPSMSHHNEHGISQKMSGFTAPSPLLWEQLHQWCSAPQHSETSPQNHIWICRFSPGPWHLLLAIWKVHQHGHHPERVKIRTPRPCQVHLRVAPSRWIPHQLGITLSSLPLLQSRKKVTPPLTAITAGNRGIIFFPHSQNIPKHFDTSGNVWSLRTSASKSSSSPDPRNSAWQPGGSRPVHLLHLVATAMWPNSLGSLCPEFGKARWHSDASHTSHCRCLDHTCLAARSASSGLFFEKSSSCHQLSISRTEALSICLGQLMKLKTSETHCKLEVLGKGAQSGAQSGSVGPAWGSWTPCRHPSGAPPCPS